MTAPADERNAGSSDPGGSGPAPAAHDAPGIHRHEHAHDEEVHRHPHHHPERRGPVHEHAHGTGFERLTYLVSPLHDLDPRAKILAAVALVLAVVLTPPLRPLEAALLVALLLAVAIIGRLPLRAVLARAALVLPVAATIALFAPVARSGGSLSIGGIAGAYAGGGWIATWAILSKAGMSALVMVLLSATTPLPRLIRGFEALRVPDVFITLVSFLSRYVGVLREELRCLRTALDCRAPSLARARRWRLYGNLAGNLFVRAYDRGERIHAAMMSRGFDGRLPTAEALRVRSADALLLALAFMTAVAVALY
jgi:cobalt/nickel transport system permease protein